MNPSRSGRVPLAAMCAALVALTLAVSGAVEVDGASASGNGATVITSDGAVRGVDVPGGYAFRGLPYATPPTGDLRWRAAKRPGSWSGIRDATQYAPSCPQKPSLFEPPGPQSEDCLYLNVSTPTLRRRSPPTSSAAPKRRGRSGRSRAASPSAASSRRSATSG